MGVYDALCRHSVRFVSGVKYWSVTFAFISFDTRTVECLTTRASDSKTLFVTREYIYEPSLRQERTFSIEMGKPSLRWAWMICRSKSACRKLPHLQSKISFEEWNFCVATWLDLKSLLFQFQRGNADMAASPSIGI